MTKDELIALSDDLQKDRPELVALINKDFKISLIMEALSILRRRCDDFIDNKYFVASEGEKRFFGGISDDAITQWNVLDMMQTNLSLKLRAAREN